ncbi:hypothetical protein F4604DRAFT_1187218 [Suillus subluteus]|nr:hypothetical protein F4604DRAFT_1187218 [Suillus subluteus]
MAEPYRASIFTRHWTLALVIVIPLIVPTAVHQYHSSRYAFYSRHSIFNMDLALSMRRHVTQNSEGQPAGNRYQHCHSQHYATHRDALQQPAPQIMPVPSYTLVNSTRYQRSAWLHALYYSSFCLSRVSPSSSITPPFYRIYISPHQTL